ncbi:Uncharacterised protein [Pseudomonas fluorescens]|nr:Uncharacterised protein [Pseudomonas fluorescens]
MTRSVIDYAIELTTALEPQFVIRQVDKETEVKAKLRVVRSVAQARYSEKLPEIELLKLTENGKFTPENPGDIVALLFETVTRWNRNPDLWRIPGAGGAEGEINTTLNNFTRGPRTMGGSTDEGVKATTYAEAIEQLLDIVSKRKPF